jgi:hypothetical protein
MTKVQRLMVVLSACNLVMLAFALAQLRPAAVRRLHRLSLAQNPHRCEEKREAPTHSTCPLCTSLHPVLV